MYNMTMKYIVTLVSLSFLTSFINAAPDLRSDKEKPQIEKPHPQKIFPKHWGHPPKIQTRDIVDLPYSFGRGSSTLAHWIMEKLTQDAKDSDGEEGKKKPIEVLKPKPPVKPRLRPVCPPEVKQKMDVYNNAQKELQGALREKLQALGKKAPREQVRKIVEKFLAHNKDSIEEQRELGKAIQDWQKENRPAPPKRPELTASVKKKIKTVHEKQKVLDESRHALLEHLKGSKDLSKEDRCDLIKDFKEENAGKHQALKIAQKALVQEVREKAQTKDRRE